MPEPSLHISPLSHLQHVAAALPSYHLLTLLSPANIDDSIVRSLAPRRRLQLAFHDVVEVTPDLIAPTGETMQAIIDFGRSWTRESPMLIHCWAGISRSSAAAFVLACDNNPGREQAIAEELRRRAPFATPNRLMVALADDLLQRQGRMVDAVARIGRGVEAFEGTPYQLPVCF